MGNISPFFIFMSLWNELIIEKKKNRCGCNRTEAKTKYTINGYMYGNNPTPIVSTLGSSSPLSPPSFFFPSPSP